jgi:hypothetical protein
VVVDGPARHRLTSHRVIAVDETRTLPAVGRAVAWWWPGGQQAVAGAAGRPSSGERTLAQARFARIASVTEARLEDAGSGLAPATEGWFVVEQGEPA